MERKQRGFGTNRDMAHGVTRPAGEQRISDSALLRQARRDAAKWQQRLAKERRAEEHRRAS